MSHFDFTEAGAMRQLTSDWSEREIKLLLNASFMSQVREVLTGSANIVRHKHIIDCSADPFIPKGVNLISHTTHQDIEWNLERITLFQTKKQADGNCIHMPEALAQIPSGTLPLNANVLDYLIDHPFLMPSDWEDKVVYFTETIYQKKGDVWNELLVRGINQPRNGYCYGHRNESGNSYSFGKKSFIALYIL